MCISNMSSTRYLYGRPKGVWCRSLKRGSGIFYLFPSRSNIRSYLRLFRYGEPTDNSEAVAPGSISSGDPKIRFTST